MKTKDVPQDLKYYKGTVIRDQDYAIDENGHYQMVCSDGWAPKNEALEITIDAIDDECREIIRRIRAGETSPLEYHMVKGLMDIGLLSSYSGFSKRTIRKHFKPDNFNNLDDATLGKYADVLRITVDELKRVPDID